MQEETYDSGHVNRSYFVALSSFMHLAVFQSPSLMHQVATEPSLLTSSCNNGLRALSLSGVTSPVAALASNHRHTWPICMSKHKEFQFMRGWRATPRHAAPANEECTLDTSREPPVNGPDARLSSDRRPIDRWRTA